MIRTAVIGVGSMGSHHAQVYSELEGAGLVGLADIDPQAARTASERFGRKVYLDYREMLAVERPQAVSIAVPVEAHEQIALAALQAQAHVLVEKPIAVTLDSGKRILACARQNGRQLMVGHIERFNPAVLRLKQELQSGRPGRIRQIVCRRMSPFPERVQDVGVVMDLALHDLDVLRFLTGRLPEQVYAHTAHQLQGAHEDMLLGLLRYGEGMSALLDVNWLSPLKVRELLVYTENGLLHADTLQQTLRLHPAGGEREPLALQVSADNPLKLELQAFLQAAASPVPDPAPGEEGLSALYLALELLESGKSGQVRHVSPP